MKIYFAKGATASEQLFIEDVHHSTIRKPDMRATIRKMCKHYAEKLLEIVSSTVQTFAHQVYSK